MVTSGEVIVKRRDLVKAYAEWTAWSYGLVRVSTSPTTHATLQVKISAIQRACY